MASLYQKFMGMISGSSKRAKGAVGIEQFEAKIILSCTKPASMPISRVTASASPVNGIIRRSVSTGEILGSALIHPSDLVREATGSVIPSYEPPSFSRAKIRDSVRPLRKSYARKLPVPEAPTNVESFAKAKAQAKTQSKKVAQPQVDKTLDKNSPELKEAS